MTTAAPTTATSRFETRWVAEVLVLAALYFLAARLGLLLAMSGGHVTPVWPPSGIALAALLLRGPRVWPGVWLGSFTANLWDFYGGPTSLATELGTSATFGVGASLAALCGNQLLRRFVGERNPLDRVRDVCAFMALGGVVSCLASATVGVTALCLGGYAPWSGYGQTWLTWWLGDTAGVFVAAPLLLVWNGTKLLKTAARWLELVACFGLLIAVAYFVFIENTTTLFTGKPLTFLCVPVIAWPAVRFGRHGAATAVGLIALLAVWGTIHDSGPFHAGSRNESLLLLELFLSVMVLTALTMAAMVTERGLADVERQRAIEELESRVQERTAALTQSEAQVRQHLAEAERGRTALLSILEDERTVKAALRESEERFRTMCEASPVATFLIRPDGHATYVNAADMRMTGLSWEASMGLGWLQAVHPDDRPQVMADWQAAQLAGRSYAGTGRYLHPDGKVVWWDVVTAAVRDGDTLLGYVGVGVDITQRKQAEAELQVTFSTLRLFIDAVPSFIAFVDAEERYQLVNRRYEEWFSLPQEQIVGRKLNELHRPATYATMTPRIREVKEGRPVLFDSELIGRDGKTYWFDIRYVPRHSPDGAWLGHFVLALDVTERQRAEIVKDSMLALETRLSAAATPQEAAQAIFDTADKLWSWDAGSLDVHSRADDQVWPVMAFDVVDGKRCEVSSSRVKGEPSGRVRRIMRDGAELYLRVPPFTPMPDAVAFGDKARLSASIMAVPIRTQGPSVGILSLQSYTPDAFNEADLKLLQGLADHCGGAMERLRATEELRASEERFSKAFRLSPDAIALWRVSDRHITDVNESFVRVSGFRREELIGHSGWDSNLWVRREDRERYVTAMSEQRRVAPFEAEFRVKSGEHRVGLVSAEILDFSGEPHVLSIIRDVTEGKLAGALLTGQRQVLEMIATGAPLTESMTALALVMEAQSPEMLCSLLLLDETGVHLRHLAAPNLPEVYSRAIDGVVIGPNVGSCGTAAFRCERVIVEDIATDPLWSDYRALALSHGLRACWSTPILDTQDRVLATFAIYYRQPGRPPARHLQLIDVATQLAAIAINKQRAEEALQRYGTIFQQAGWGMVIVDPDTNVLTRVNPTFARMHGYTVEEMSGMNLADTFTPESRAELPAHTEASQDKGHHTYESIHLRKDGSQFPCLTDVTAFKDATGRVTFRAATLEDITERKRAETMVRNLVAGTSSVTGAGFFPAFVRHLAAALGVRYALVTELLPDRKDQLRTIAGWAGDRLLPNWEYSTANTPCELVVNETRAVCYTDRVRELFPKDKELATMGAVSYLAVPLLTADGKALGHVCILDDKPMEEPERALAIVRIFAARAATELERKRTDEKMKALSRRVLDVQEAERRHLARELHDQIGQALVAVQFDVKACRKMATQPEVIQRLADTVKTLEQTQEQVLNLSLKLRPSTLDDFGLASALRHYTQEQAERTGFRAQFHSTLSNARLESGVETACYRVAQEAITNVVRHARARQLTVSLREDADMLHLTVADDGAGFDPNRIRRSGSPDADLGLLGMEERVKLVGGWIKFESKPGEGTTVCAHFPSRPPVALP